MRLIIFFSTGTGFLFMFIVKENILRPYLGAYDHYLIAVI